ncbi:MAG TPA: hypothetical protein VMV92_25740 [Streptosporangiaceae bacterium]|nr:hypothetical protein [Streptosporangiaceae bacterium]
MPATLTHREMPRLKSPAKGVRGPATGGSREQGTFAGRRGGAQEHDPDGRGGVTVRRWGGGADGVPAVFPWQELRAELTSLRAAVTGPAAG